jgi:hypothetical protein
LVVAYRGNGGIHRGIYQLQGDGTNINELRAKNPEPTHPLIWPQKADTDAWWEEEDLLSVDCLFLRSPSRVRISIGMPNFEMPNLDSVNHCTSDFLTGTMVDFFESEIKVVKKRCVALMHADQKKKE